MSISRHINPRLHLDVLTVCICPFSDTFHINPRLHLVLTVPEEVVVSLTQHTVTEPRVVGFTVYPVSNGTVDAIDNSFFKKKSLVNSQYTNGRQVTREMCPGGCPVWYVIQDVD